VWVNAIGSWIDIVLAAAAFALLRFAKAPPWSVVLFAGLAGWLGA
jgi:hypothetical protein